MAYQVVPAYPRKYRSILRELSGEQTGELHVGITDDCNLRCKYCGNGYRWGNKNYMTLGMFQFLVNEFQFRSVGFSLGEPTKHPKIARFVDISLENWLSVTIITNGFRSDVLKDLFKVYGGSVKYFLSVSRMHSQQYQERGQDLGKRVKKLEKLAKKTGAKLHINPLLFMCDVGFGRNHPRAIKDREPEGAFYVGPEGKIFADADAWYESIDARVMATIEKQ